MSTTVTTPKWETELDAVLHALLSLGAIAANIFVKSPLHRQMAGQVILGVNQALPVVDSLLGQPVAETAPAVTGN